MYVAIRNYHVVVVAISSCPLRTKLIMSQAGRQGAKK